MNSVELADHMKADILRDVLAGIIPASLTGFAELHDHVDANTYGGTEELLTRLTAGAPQTDEGAQGALMELLDLMNPAIKIVDDWIRNHGIISGIGDARPASVIPRISDEAAMRTNMDAIDRIAGVTTYRHIVAWGKWLGFTPVAVQRELALAVQENAPADAIQKQDGRWARVGDIANDLNRQAVERLAESCSSRLQEPSRPL